MLIIGLVKIVEMAILAMVALSILIVIAKS
jgi:hypothetical protein